MADQGLGVVAPAAIGDAFVAFRGGTALSADQVKAHLASLVRLENVGVFLGAGASLGAGGRTMAQVLAALTSDFPRSTQWLAGEGFELMDLERLLDALEVGEHRCSST